MPTGPEQVQLLVAAGNPHTVNIFRQISENKKLLFRNEILLLLFGNHKSIILIVLLWLTDTILQNLIIYQIHLIIDNAIQKSNLLSLYSLISWIIFVILLKTGARLTSRYLSQKTGNQFVSNIRALLHEKLVRSSSHDVANFSEGQLTDRVMRTTEGAKDILTEGLPAVVSSAASLVCALAFLFHLDWRSAMVAISPLFILPFLCLIQWRHQQSMSRSLGHLIEKLQQVLHESFAGHREIKAFRMEFHREETFSKLSFQIQNLRTKLSIIQSSFDEFGSILIYFAMAAIWFWGSLRIIQGDPSLKLGSLLAVSTYALFLFSSLRVLIMVASLIPEISVTLERIQTLLELSPKENPRQISLPATKRGREIRFDRVTFGYNIANPILKDLSLTISPSEFVGIVGPSGAGKSTILNICAGLIRPASGSVTIDGVNIADLKGSNLLDYIAIVPQEPYIFSASVYQNIVCGRTVLEEKTISIAKAIGLHDFISGFESGYDTIIHAGLLSGGQKQRFALARALLSSPSIILLDEATSAIDEEGRNEIHNAILQRRNGATIISVTHNLRTIEQADRILSLDKQTLQEYC